MKRFKVTKQGYYFWVYLYPTRTEFLVVKDEKFFVKGPAGAFCHLPFTNTKSLGAMVFNPIYSDVGTIAHECMHMAIHFDHLVNSRRRLTYYTVASEQEEEMCALLDYFVTKVYNGLQKIGAPAVE